MASNYLPLLLVSVAADNAAAPDDSNVTTLPTGQVDYLSHQWREEDVWSSWKNMTRQKNAIANGSRLENASWRTWWKQRNKLKTISPETLNWLKDSDVTWLYGPLHPGSDWEPLPKVSTPPRPALAQNIPTGCYTKPILKHRSIVEILSLPTAPHSDADQSPETPASNEPQQQPPSAVPPPTNRPFLTHTKSDTHILRARTPRDALRKDSPPRVLSKESAEFALSVDESTSTGTSTGSEQDLMGHNPQSSKRKHITFNTFVQQCIAIENPKPIRPPARFVDEVFEDDGYDQDSEGYFDNPHVPPSSKTYYPTTTYEDSDSDSDDVLEIQTSSSRSRSSSSSRSGLPPFAPTSTSSSPDRTSVLHDDDHRTIAYIAPTILKTNDIHIDPLDPLDPSTQFPGVELVYVPPIRMHRHSPYLRAGSLSGTPDIYERQIDYFDPRGSSSQSSSSSNTSPNFPSVGIPPSASDETLKSGDWSPDYSDPIANPEPLPISDGPEISQKEDAFDFTEEPDFMENFPKKGIPIARTRSIDGQSGPGYVRYARGSAESSSVGRCSPEDDKPGTLGPTKQDTVIRPPEQLSTAVSHKPLQRASSYDQVTQTDNKLLAPDVVIRGRSSSSSCLNSVSGSTTSPSTSHTRSSDSRSESRGRSSTRNSSYSDRERSNSRSSRSGGSPIGSISPCGSTIGIGGQSAGRESRSVYRQPGRERGRDRTGRRINGSSSSSSLSPPDVSSPIRGVTAEYVPAHTDSYSSLNNSMSQSIVSSAASSSSTIGPNSDSTSTVTQGSDDGTEKGQLQVQPQPQPMNPVVSTPVHTRPSRPSRTGQIVIPTAIPEEEETQRSRNPTPANSPTDVFKPLLPVPTSTVDVGANSEDKREAMGENNKHTGLVGRAAGMVTSARGLIGSFWHPGPL